MVVTCPSGHRLQSFTAVNKVCDGCDGEIKGSTFACFTCDFDLCAECNAKKSAEAEASNKDMRDKLKDMSKDELVDIIMQMRSAEPELAAAGSAAFMPVPKLTRSTSVDEQTAWRAIAGHWENDLRAIYITGNVDAPTVSFTKNKFRDARKISVSDAKVHVKPSGELSFITFKIRFPPDASSASGEAEWKLFTTGEGEILGDGEIVPVKFQRPMPRPIALKTHAGPARAMARMTEPSSKALGLFDELLPFNLYNKAGEPWCLPVLRTEAALRLEEAYLEKTACYFDDGLVPPIDICEAVEKKALGTHGIAATPSWIEAYRFAARMLSKEQRQDIFFLRANDEMFRPKVELMGKVLEGSLLSMAAQLTGLQEVLKHPRSMLIASTSS
eukprot:gb/GFBE01080958.1/.p1 GENE.gb/GFBE01080958.1/~~gb/GFBE01080958.1/.p1  ORF type:complete len:386 (+),score=91.22 gb/GFBE01080958.1/:1-1158(+)